MQKFTHVKYRMPNRPIFAVFHSIIIELVIISHFFEMELFDLPPDLG